MKCPELGSSMSRRNHDRSLVFIYSQWWSITHDERSARVWETPTSHMITCECYTCLDDVNAPHNISLLLWTVQVCEVSWFLNHSNLGIFLTNAVTYHMQLLHKMFPLWCSTHHMSSRKAFRVLYRTVCSRMENFQSVLNMTNFEFQNCFLLFLIILIISMFGTFLNLSSFLNYWTCCENVHCLILKNWFHHWNFHYFLHTCYPFPLFRLALTYDNLPIMCYITLG